jgi:hypothetical protein
MNMYAQPTTHTVESPVFVKDGYKVIAFISGLPVKFDPNLPLNPNIDATLRITSDELFTFGPYPTHDFEVDNDKKAWGPWSSPEGDAIAAQVWDDEVDKMIATVVRQEMLNVLNKQVEQNQNQVDILNDEHRNALEALKSVTERLDRSKQDRAYLYYHLGFWTEKDRV